MEFPHIEKKLRAVGCCLNMVHAVKSFVTDQAEFIKKLESYIQDYLEQGNEEGVKCLRTVITDINGNDWAAAFKHFKEGYEHLGGLPQSWYYLKEHADDQLLEKKGLLHWGETPGKYIAYRAGSLARASRGIYFASSHEDAEQYAKLGNEYRPVKKYLLEVKHPLVAQHQRDAIETLGEQPLEQTMHAYQRHLDEQLARLLKKNGYDSAVLLRPAEPAIRELVIVDPISIVEQLD